MSFMLVTGKIFLCNVCQKRLKVNYEGGALYTQIGDNRIMQQQDIADSYKQPNPNPNEEGYYLYDIGLCENCWEVQVDGGQKSMFEEIVKIMNTNVALRDNTILIIEEMLPNLTENIACAMTIEDVKSAIATPIDLTLGDKHATLSKRQKLCKSFAQHHRDALENYIIDKSWMDSDIKEVVDNYNNAAQPLHDRLKKLIGKSRILYYSKETNAAENLNGYILAETTVRKPVEGSPDELFLFEQEMEADDVVEMFDISSSITWIDLSQTVRDIVERVMLANNSKITTL